MSALGAVALKQVSRLSGLKYYPSKEGIRELVACLSATCKSEHHIGAVVDEWLRGQSDSPTPADLRRVAESLKPVYVPAADAPDCPGCGGTGWATGYQEYVPFIRHGHCRYHVRSPAESEAEFTVRMSHYHRNVMPEGRAMAECCWTCQCATGQARRKREEF